MKLGVAAFQRSQENLINFGGQITHSFTLNKEEGITCSAGLDSIYNYFGGRFSLA